MTGSREKPADSGKTLTGALIVTAQLEQKNAPDGRRRGQAVPSTFEIITLELSAI